jgi:hypothetical protein
MVIRRPLVQAQAEKRELGASIDTCLSQPIIFQGKDNTFILIVVGRRLVCRPFRVPNADTYEALDNSEQAWCYPCSIFQLTNQHLKDEE